MRLLLIFLLFVLPNTKVITNNSVDGVKVGSTIKSFLQKAKERNIVKKGKLELEGDPYDIYNVFKDGKKIYAVEPDEKGAQVYRIWVYSSEFRTEAGIGVGSTLAEIKSKYKIDYISTEGEDGIVVGVKGLSIGFILDNSKLPKNWWNQMDLNKVPKNIPVIEIII